MQSGGVGGYVEGKPLIRMIGGSREIHTAAPSPLSPQERHVLNAAKLIPSWTIKSLDKLF